MLNTLRKYSSSIAFKLFISFWLFAIISIAITRFISTQLADEDVIMPVHQSDSRILNHIAKRLAKTENISIPQAIAHSTRLPGMSIAIKNKQTSQVFTSQRPLSLSLVPYLEKNSFTTPTTIQFINSRITGPSDITLNNQVLQLYLIVKDRKPHFSHFVMQLPTWARVIIPVIVSMLLAWLLARSLSQPILAMKQATKNLADGNLTTRVAPKVLSRNDELGALAQDFNYMADKLTKNITAHQRLLGDVSHELRSPMTRLQMAIGLAQQSINNSDSLAKHLTRCELEVSRLDDMISEVLALSRMENTIEHIDKQPLNLSQLLADCICDCQYIANEKAVIIEAKQPSQCQFNGDINLLTSVFSNVLTNAVKYSPADSRINVTMTIEQQQIIIAIADAGSGVPQESLSQLFQPFYRVEQARDRGTGGTGLGLAISKQAVLAHNGHISAINNQDAGLTITIVLPKDAS